MYNENLINHLNTDINKSSLLKVNAVIYTMPILSSY